MKIDPHAALLAAQNLRTGDASARGREASASFFAELKKAGNQTANLRETSPQATRTKATKPAATGQSVQVNLLREAPLRQIDPAKPTPPGSLLNILV